MQSFGVRRHRNCRGVRYGLKADIRNWLLLRFLNEQVAVYAFFGSPVNFGAAGLALPLRLGSPHTLRRSDLLLRIMERPLHNGGAHCRGFIRRPGPGHDIDLRFHIGMPCSNHRQRDVLLQPW